MAVMFMLWKFPFKVGYYKLLRDKETVSNMFQSISSLYQFPLPASGMECNIYCLRVWNKSTVMRPKKDKKLYRTIHTDQPSKTCESLKISVR